MDIFIGTIMWVSFFYAPMTTLEANGQCLPINNNQALFSLISTRYGGDGRSNFCLPDLRPKRLDGTPDSNWNNGPRAVIVTEGLYPMRPQK